MTPRRTPGAVAALLRAAGRIFPLTGRGLLLCLLAGVMAAAGLARSDLAALFWGASFLLYAVYSIAASHLSMLFLARRKRAHPDFLSVILPRKSLGTGEEAEAHISAHLPRALAPGFFVRFILPLSWHDRSLTGVSCRLGPGETEREIPFRTGRRGTYRSSEAVLEVRDVLGFTANRIRPVVSETLTVNPTVKTGQSWRILTEGDDPAATTSRRRRSEELLEVRKYYPGDDARRLNWKIFAHSGELFLRVGEETPPPQSRLLFVLDTTSNPLVPRQLADDYLDGLVDACASAMAALASERVEVLLCRPGAKDCRAFAEEGRTQLLAALADQWWTEGPWQPPLPDVPHMHTAVFSTPGSPGLASILAQIRDKGWTTSLFLKEPPPRGAPSKLSLRDILLVPGDQASPAARPGSRSAAGPQSAVAILRAEAALNKALARDLVTYGGPGWRVRHAREI
ncbi:MAG: DUF58 domain-containing protein [Spirochaetia bacterium]